MSKTRAGHFFEDFEVGQRFEHAVPRTVTEGDAALYAALTGSRFLMQSDAEFARSAGLPARPIDDLHAFHVVFGKSVPDISLNAVANLGYAEGRLHKIVLPGDTLRARSTILGKKENSSGRAGVVWLRTEGFDQKDAPVWSYVRWVMVNKKDPASPAPEPVIPELAEHVEAGSLRAPEGLGRLAVDPIRSGSPHFFEDYEIGEKIDHGAGMALAETEHRTATRLYQNTARVHFDDWAERHGRLGACIVYGGVVLSIARALSFEGLGNVFHLLAINGGVHAHPCFAGDTVYAWSEVLDKAHLEGRDDVAALRLRLVATKDQPCSSFPLYEDDGRRCVYVLLDFDYWALIPTRAAKV